jgi:hypothetical protein
MIALAQGGAGLALVMGFALLGTRQLAAASVLLVVQSGGAAATAVALNLPWLAVSPVLLAAGVWLLRAWTPMLDPDCAPVGGAKVGVGVGAALAILCQSQGSLALPLTIVLLSILLAATRPHPVMQVVALVAMQNGIILAGSLVGQLELLAGAMLHPLALPIACFVLPLPLAAGLLGPAAVSLLGHATVAESWQAGLRRAAAGLGWADLVLAVLIFVTTLLIPFDALASIFAPLLGLDGVLRSCARLHRGSLTAGRRAAALLQTGFTVLAVSTQNPMVAWMGVLAATAAALLPALSWRWDRVLPAYPAAGLGLFSLLLLPVAPSVLAYFSLFAGFAVMSAVVPDLCPALVILLLRQAIQAPWPAGAATLGIAVGLIGALACAILLFGPVRRHRATLLQLGQASVAALAVCLGQPDGRFAALVLLILLILTRAALRIADGPAATLALAGLGGALPVGVFPALVLVVLALSERSPWLLLPLGAAIAAMVAASVPRRLPALQARITLRSIAWLPLVIVILVGYFAPDGLVHWWHNLTAGPT